ncbi:hypothetical protein AAFF_G00002070 [Aldrovandia affinis]|uniref:Uncharacterized protein n=1 Tax=Aldrovandia affinis TaxID=143900 RepID=A0AAD7X3H5_9TELE|nr:hypothetical protein AAFF_G00002070 [Aldrovandia affinis]
MCGGGREGRPAEWRPGTLLSEMSDVPREGAPGLTPGRPASTGALGFTFGDRRWGSGGMIRAKGKGGSGTGDNQRAPGSHLLLAVLRRGSEQFYRGRLQHGRFIISCE